MPYADPAHKNIRAAEYRAANRAVLRERSRAYRLAHPEAVEAANARYYQEHAESAREAARGRYHADTLRYRERSRQWATDHPTRIAALACSSDANRRSRRFGRDDRITADDLEALWLREPTCADCGLVGRGVDHAVALRDGGSNSPANLANRCVSCNVRKEHRARKARAA